MRHCAGAAREEHDQRNDPLGFDGLEEGVLDLAERAITDRLGHHPGVADWQHRVGQDAVFGALDRDHVRQSDEAGLRRSVGGVVVWPTADLRHDEDEAPVALRFHRPEGGLRQVEAAIEVDTQHRSPPFRSDLVKRRGLVDPGIANHRVDSAEGVERDLHDRGAPFRAVHRVVRGDCGATSTANLVDHAVSNARVDAFAAHRTADVVHHDSRPRRAISKVETVQATPRAGHDRHLAVEADHDANQSRHSPVITSKRIPRQFEIVDTVAA